MHTCSVTYMVEGRQNIFPLTQDRYPEQVLRGYDSALVILAERYGGTELGNGYSMGYRDVVFSFKFRHRMQKFIKVAQKVEWVTKVQVLNKEPLRVD